MEQKRDQFSGSNALALESLCDALRHSFFQNEKVYITHLGLLYQQILFLEEIVFVNTGLISIDRSDFCFFLLFMVAIITIVLVDNSLVLPSKPLEKY